MKMSLHSACSFVTLTGERVQGRREVILQPDSPMQLVRVSDDVRIEMREGSAPSLYPYRRGDVKTRMRLRNREG